MVFCPHVGASSLYSYPPFYPLLCPASQPLGLGGLGPSVQGRQETTIYYVQGPTKINHVLCPVAHMDEQHAVSKGAHMHLLELTSLG